MDLDNEGWTPDNGPFNPENPDHLEYVLDMHKATDEGPWLYNSWFQAHQPIKHPLDDKPVIQSAHERIICTNVASDEGEFICIAHEVIPALISEIRRLQLKDKLGLR